MRANEKVVPDDRVGFVAGVSIFNRHRTRPNRNHIIILCTYIYTHFYNLFSQHTFISIFGSFTSHLWSLLVPLPGKIPHVSVITRSYCGTGELLRGPKVRGTFYGRMYTAGRRSRRVGFPVRKSLTTIAYANTL